MGEIFIVLFEDLMPQNFAYSAITHENRGGGLAQCPRPRFLRVMMSKKKFMSNDQVIMRNNLRNQGD